MLDVHTREQLAKLRRAELLREAEHNRLIAHLRAAESGRHRGAILARVVAALRALLATLHVRLFVAQRAARPHAHRHPDGDEHCWY